VDLDGFAYGVRRFVIGLAKKVLIANVVAGPADKIFSMPAAQLTAGHAWLAITCYTLQIYFDFSGYSDMAIGLGRMFGFRFPENFRWPYIADSVQEFWRRWTPLRHVFLLLVVMVGWVFFRADTLSVAIDVLNAMSGLGRAVPSPFSVGWYLTPELWLAIVAGAIGSMPVVPALSRRFD